MTARMYFIFPDNLLLWRFAENCHQNFKYSALCPVRQPPPLPCYTMAHCEIQNYLGLTLPNFNKENKMFYVPELLNNLRIPVYLCHGSHEGSYLNSYYRLPLLSY